jgi:hypothetical protein
MDCGIHLEIGQAMEEMITIGLTIWCAYAFHNRIWRR